MDTFACVRHLPAAMRTPAGAALAADRPEGRFYTWYINRETDLPTFLVRIREKRFQKGRLEPGFAAREGLSPEAIHGTA